MFRGDGPAAVARSLYEREDYIQQVLAFDVTAGQPVRVEKLVALFTSHDNAVTEPLAAAGRHVLRYPDFAAALLAVSSVAANVWRATLAISREIAAPSTPSPVHTGPADPHRQSPVVDAVPSDRQQGPGHHTELSYREARATQQMRRSSRLIPSHTRDGAERDRDQIERR